MKNDIRIRVWVHDDVRKALPSLPRKSYQAYCNEFYNKLLEGYYPPEGNSVAGKQDEFYFVLSTKERVIYKLNESGINIERIEVYAFLWEIRNKLILLLDHIGRVITLHQIVSILVSTLHQIVSILVSTLHQIVSILVSILGIK